MSLSFISCFMQVYFGSITRTSKYCLSMHFGNDPTTSANPPVLINGTPSDATKRIFFITNLPIAIINNNYTTSLPSIKAEFSTVAFHAQLHSQHSRISEKTEQYKIFQRYFSRILSAMSAMNSEFVGFPFPVLIVYPNMSSRVSILPRFHATSIA